MPQEIPNQRAIFSHPLGARPVGDPGRLHDRVVVTHVVDNAHETVIEHLERLAEDGIQFRNGSAGDHR